MCTQGGGETGPASGIGRPKMSPVAIVTDLHEVVLSRQMPQ
jgi:hypothetical protein